MKRFLALAPIQSVSFVSFLCRIRELEPEWGLTSIFLFQSLIMETCWYTKFQPSSQSVFGSSQWNICFYYYDPGNRKHVNTCSYWTWFQWYIRFGRKACFEPLVNLCVHILAYFRIFRMKKRFSCIDSVNKCRINIASYCHCCVYRLVTMLLTWM